MSDIALVRTVFADAGGAGRIGRAMVEAQRAACVDRPGPCRSIDRWRGAIEPASEYRAPFKTTRRRARELADRIAALHGHDPSMIEISPAAAGDAVLARVSETTR